MFTIQKSCRAHADRPDSYFGPSWSKAGINHLYREQFDDEQEAKDLARRLTEVNPVGFVVVKYEPAE